MRRPTIAVTGATGFIGGQVLRSVASSGYPVRAAVRPDSIRWHVDDIDCQFKALELEQTATVRRFVRGAGAVIHCAGYAPARARPIEQARRRAVRQFRTLLDACRTEGVHRVVYISHACTVVEEPLHQQGDETAAQNRRRDETSRYLPGSIDNAFFEAKGWMEAEAYRYIAGGLDVVLVLPAMVLGPGDVKMKTGRLIRALARGRVPALPTGATINVVDVRDVAAGVVAALERGRPGRRYLLAGTDIDIGDLLARLARRTGASVPDRRVEAQAVHSLAGIAEGIVDRLGIGIERIPPLAVATELARRIGPLSGERAEGELQLGTRTLGATLDDTIDWMKRVGYFSWARAER